MAYLFQGLDLTASIIFPSVAFWAVHIPIQDGGVGLANQDDERDCAQVRRTLNWSSFLTF
jgi:hypothetical protein